MTDDPATNQVPLTVTSESNDSLGPLTVEVVPEAGDSIAEFVLSSVHQEHQFLVQPGRHMVIARRPNGERLYRPVTVESGNPATVYLRQAIPPSPNEFMTAETNRGEVALAFSKKREDTKLGVLRGYAGDAVRLSALERPPAKSGAPQPKQHPWTLRAWAEADRAQLSSASFVVEAGASFVKVITQPRCLAIGLLDESGVGPVVMTPPFKQPLHITFPAECLLGGPTPRYLRATAQRPLVAFVTPGEPAVADLLAAVAASSMEHTDALWKQNSAALRYLYEKYDDPAAAFVGAHFLLRYLPNQLPLKWADNLCRLVANVADGAVISAWLRLTGASEEIRSRSPKKLGREVDDFIARAIDRPIVWFARTRRLLADGSRLAAKHKQKKGIKNDRPLPSDYLEFGAHAGGLEAFWGRHPFSPGLKLRGKAPPSIDLATLRLSGVTFTRADASEAMVGGGPVRLGGSIPIGTRIPGRRKKRKATAASPGPAAVKTAPASAPIAKSVATPKKLRRK